MKAERGLHGRMLRGAQAQIASHVIRIVVQLGMVSALLPLWGLHLYGEWLVLSAVPTYLTVSDLGLFSAATTDMTMAVGREDRDHARDVFRAVSRGVAVVFVLAAVLLPAAAVVVPIVALLNFHEIQESAAVVVIVALALRTLLVLYTSLLYGAFACDGNYGAGTTWSAMIVFAEFAALVAVAAAGFGPGPGAVAMLVCRVIGMLLMYRALRRRSPWLSLGRPLGEPQVLRRLTSPGLASAAIEAGLAVNLQGMVILVGMTVSPAGAAIFTTLRTVGRVVIQLLTSISQVVAPELARAYGENDHAALRTLHRRASQTAVWAATPILLFLAVFGGTFVHVWSSGEVSADGWLLPLFLIGAGVDTLWLTSGSILVWTNRHQRVSAIFMIVSLLSLPTSWLMLRSMGLDGGALVLVLMEVVMLFVVLPSSLRAAHDSLGRWAATVLSPPMWAVVAVRGRLARRVPYQA